MNWTDLIAALNAAGMTDTDKADAVSVKAFLGTRPVKDTEGNTLDVDAMFKAHSEKPLVVSLTRDGDRANFDAARKDATTKAADIAGRANPEPQRFTIGNAARKAYQTRIASCGVGKEPHQARFNDVDIAETCGAFIRLAIAGTNNYRQKATDLAITKGQVEFDNSLGGSLVPYEFVSQLLYSTEPYGVARKLANVQRMTESVQGRPRKTGIPKMSWVGEGQATTVKDATLENVELVAKKLQLIMSSSNELFEDSAIGIADLVAETVREAYDVALDTAYFSGDGTSDFGGYSGLTQALPTGAYLNSGAWSAFTTANFNVGLGSLQNINPARLKMAGSRQAYHQICKRLELATSQFKGLTGPATAGADAMFLDVPFYFTQAMPIATGGTGTRSIYIGDFMGASMIGERRDLTITASEHAAFSSDSIQWRATARAAINIHGDGRTPASTVGPIVCLVTS